MSIKDSQRTGGNSNRIPNPAAHILKWHGEDGCFIYYDKVEGETKQVNYEDLEFIVLDRRCRVTGWDDDNNCRIYSNAVKSTTKEKFVVRTSHDNSVLAEGLYADIKSKEFKYEENLFCYGTVDGENWVTLQINLSGSSLGVWSAFVNDEVGNFWDIHKGSVKISGLNDNKKGRIEWITPTFTFTEFEDDSKGSEAVEVYEETFEPYLDQFVSRTEEEIPA